MRKKLASLLLAVAVTMNPFSCIAGQWINYSGNWYYLDDNGNYLNNQWVGNYYLGSNGVMMTNSWTPDGYYVGADGAWNGQPAITTSNTGSYSDASQQAEQEVTWNGKYYVHNHIPVNYWDSEGNGVDYLHADNNSVHIKGCFRKVGYYGDSQYLGYYDKTFVFSNNCTFMGGGESQINTYSRGEFIKYLNSNNGLDFGFTVENDVIVRAELWS